MIDCLVLPQLVQLLLLLHSLQPAESCWFLLSFFWLLLLELFNLVLLLLPGQVMLVVHGSPL